MANILVTGAGKGIGFELVREFAAGGHAVIAVSRNLDRLKKLNLENVHLVTFDLSDGNFTELTERTGNIFQSLDILINNAGAILNKSFKEITEEEMQRVYTVNVFSVVRVIQSLFPMLQNSQLAHVINISSMGGFQGAAKFPGLSVYSSSKAAVACLTECLAEEYRDTAVKFNALCLGAVQTEMLSAAFPGYQAPVKPADMARFIAGFAVSAAGIMNGKVLPVSLSTP